MFARVSITLQNYRGYVKGVPSAAAAAAAEEEEEDCIEICWCVNKKFCRSHPLIQISR
jgi:hypothetical protein